MSSSSPTETKTSPRGKLTIFLGYAAGVGKTYQMLEEAQARQRAGVDVVMGYFEPHGRHDTIARAEGLAAIPRKVVEYRGSRFEEMDTEAVLARHPQVAVVDEFPHTNIPGSARTKRWEDVLFLLDQGIDVLTTMNIQHLESLNDQVLSISGIRVRETIPDWILQRASEVVMVDLTPRALLNRLERGVVYSTDKAQRAKENFFRESTLNGLRELALRETAHEVENRNVVPGAAEASEKDSVVTTGPDSRERILVFVTTDPLSLTLIRRGKRVSDYMHGACIAVSVCPGHGLDSISAEDRDALEKHLNFARGLQIQTEVLNGPDVANALVNFAREHRVTQIYLSRPRAEGWQMPLKRGLVEEVATLARDMEVTIVAERKAHWH